MSADGARGVFRESGPVARHSGASTPTLSDVVAGAIARRRVGSDALFQGTRELVIVHMGKEYVLRITRLGKLILTT